jgi:hypothetical protein
MSKENVAKWIRHKVPSKQQVRASWNRGSFMFGRPDWFRDKEVGWGLTPITWAGWAYTVAWIAAIAGPFGGLLLMRGALPAIVWLGVSLTALVWDVRQIKSARRALVAANVYYIGDEELMKTREGSAKYTLHAKG